MHVTAQLGLSHNTVATTIREGIVDISQLSGENVWLMQVDTNMEKY